MLAHNALFFHVCDSTCKEYGEYAVGKVELKRQGTICPEHRIHPKNCTMVLALDEPEQKEINAEMQHEQVIW